jgi:hypothetical protein
LTHFLGNLCRRTVLGGIGHQNLIIHFILHFVLSKERLQLPPNIFIRDYCIDSLRPNGLNSAARPRAKRAVWSAAMIC